MKQWQIIVIRVLWSIAGVALIFLLVVAWKAKEEKKCSSIQIELVGENTTALFMDEKEILQIIKEQGVKEGLPISQINLNAVEKNLQNIRNSQEQNITKIVENNSSTARLSQMVSTSDKQINEFSTKINNLIEQNNNYNEEINKIGRAHV